ncbi:hypothetical protein GHT06_001896 [Daphnia sinensis]|uniref:Uncharacterized protein n=1 Tax=Daphnia sinensis TaxID=1820382 RepID=A0AAD5PJW5_9CRUS|nr:hypothetical protein GHT06_001896 [Daphnia sinensis]
MRCRLHQNRSLHHRSRHHRSLHHLHRTEIFAIGIGTEVVTTEVFTIFIGTEIFASSDAINSSNSAINSSSLSPVQQLGLLALLLHRNRPLPNHLDQLQRLHQSRYHQIIFAIGTKSIFTVKFVFRITIFVSSNIADQITDFVVFINDS